MKMTKSFLIRPTLRGLVMALAVTALSGFVARAVPYASGVKTNGTTVSFVLNQVAAGLTLVTNGVPFVMDGSTTGTKSFDNTGVTTWSLIVTGNTAKAWTQISSDSLTQSKYYIPQGVHVDKNPKRSTFGQIIVCEGQGGATAAGRTTTDGLYIMSADQGDVFGQGDTAYGGGVAWTTSGNSPFKVSMNRADPAGQDYTLYIGDWTDNHSGVWTADLLNPSAAFSELLDNSTRDGIGIVTNISGEVVHGSVPCGPWVEGTGANRKMYTVDEDYALGNVWQYDIGTTTSGYATTPTARVTDNPALISNGLADVVRDEDGSWWIAQYRFTDTVGTPSLSHWADNSSAASWISGDTIHLDYAYGSLDILDSQDLLVMGTRTLGAVYVVNISDPSNPTLAASIPQSAGYIRDVAFDIAGNVYSVNSSGEKLRIFSPGGYTEATTTSDATFSLYRQAELSVTATDPDASESGPDTGTFTIARKLGAGTAMQVSYTLSGTAVSNVDYTISPTSPFTFPAGETNFDITVTPINDSAPESPETVVLTLAAGADYSIVSPSSATMTITDDDLVVRYWDTNGDTNGAGDPADGTWGTDNFWTADANGNTATAAWTASAAAVFSAGADAWTPFTVTVNGTQNVGSLSFEEAGVTVDGGTLNLLNFIGTTVTGGNTLIKSVIDGSAGLTLEGPSSLGLAGANTYTGPTIINGGNLIVGADGGVIPDGSAVTVGALGKLYLDDQVFPSGPHSETIGSLAGAAGGEAIVPTGATLTFGADNTDTLWDGIITGGDGSLVKLGSGKTTLGTSGTMPLTLAISGGAISFNAAAQLASASPLTINNGATLESTSTGVGTAFLAGRPITIASGGGTLSVANATAILMVTDVISGSGTLSKDGAGELRTYSVEHTFPKLIVNEGLYTAGHSTLLGYNTSFGAIPGSPTADAITIYGGASIRKAGGQNVALDANQGITLAGIGTKTIRSYAGDANCGTFEIAGTISGTGPLQLPSGSDVAYAPVMVLKGQNTYSDGTIIPGGQVYVINTSGSGTGSGAVTVNNANLGGEGTLGGPVAVTGGTLSPGYTYYTGAAPSPTAVTKPVAKLVLTNGLDLSASGTYAWQLGALSVAIPATDFDQVELTGGNLTLGASSALAIGYTGTATAPSPGEPFWQTSKQWQQVIKFGGGGAISGNFSSITGTNGITFGTFTTTVDANGVNLLWTSTYVTPQPITDMSIGPVSAGSTSISYAGAIGNQFVLVESADVEAALNTWTPVATNTTASGSFSIPVTADPKKFYRIISE